MTGPSDISRALPAAKPLAPQGVRTAPAESNAPKDAATLGGGLKEAHGEMAEMLENMRRAGGLPPEPAPTPVPAPTPEPPAAAAAPPAPSKRKLVV